MSTYVPDVYDAADLWAAMRDKPAPENDDAIQELEDDIINYFGIDLFALAEIAGMLLPFCTVAELAISGEKARGFAKDGAFIIKQINDTAS